MRLSVINKLVGKKQKKLHSKKCSISVYHTEYFNVEPAKAPVR